VGLSLDGIGYTYAAGTSLAQPALADVSLSVVPGQTTLVLGATGSGKSTLLRVAAGLLAPSAGAVSLDGAPLTRSSARGGIGLVFQDAESQLFAETLAVDVAFGPRNLGVSGDELDERVEEALAMVGLPPSQYAQRSPFTLSGGEARRAAIAGVLAMRPRYLLLDEPTAGLDARGRRAVREAVSAARSEAGVVVVSHSAEEFLGEADSVLLLAGGTVSFAGASAEVIDHPEHFDAAGLTAPPLLRAPQLARGAGHDLGRFSLDPDDIAASIARVGGWS
jgi:energy-coupling factor transport system ATP-binding protein